MLKAPIQQSQVLFKATTKRLFYPQNREQQFEIMVGAILTQNTSWAQVEKGLVSLQNSDLLNPNKLCQNPESTKTCIRALWILQSKV